MEFESAVRLVRDAGFEASEDDRLMLYGLFKVGTAGPRPPHDQPSIFRTVDRAKWKAWADVGHALGGSEQAKEQARRRYAELVAQLRCRPPTTGPRHHG